MLCTHLTYVFSAMHYIENYCRLLVEYLLWAILLRVFFLYADTQIDKYCSGSRCDSGC